jgi:hypothetical protein
MQKIFDTAARFIETIERKNDRITQNHVLTGIKQEKRFEP